MEMQLIVAALIVCHGLIPVQSKNDIGTKVITGEIHKNFLSLFNSIQKNDLDKTEAFRKFLEEETIKEQQVFDTVKEQLRSAGQKDAYDRRNFDQKSGFTRRKVFKRQTTPFEIGPELAGNDDSSLADASDVKAHCYNLTTELAFKKLYPNLDELEPWPMAENLTVDFLRHLCINILMDVYPCHVPTVRIMRDYRDPEPGQLQATRVMRHMPVAFKDEGIKYMTLIRCVSKDFEFHVARGDDEYVFKIEKDRKSDSYFFISGPHAINFKDELR